jgi:hypothetical protein
MHSYFTLAMFLLLFLDHNDTSAASLADKTLIENAMQNLSHWKVVPFFERSIRELERMAEMKGLALPV